MTQDLSMLPSFSFYKFPHYIETTTFGISCDAFANLKETLTRHKPMVAEYLDKNYDRVRVLVYPFINSSEIWIHPSVLLLVHDAHFVH